MMSIPANELMRLRQSLEDVSRDLQEKQNEHHLTVLKSGTLQDAIERENAVLDANIQSIQDAEDLEIH